MPNMFDDLNDPHHGHLHLDRAGVGRNLFDDPYDPSQGCLFFDFVATRGRWVPTGAAPQDTRATKNAFVTLVQALNTIDGGPSGRNVMQLIPAGRPDTYDARPQTQNGFKFEWTDINGAEWHVHAHEPDHNAPANVAAGRGWVIRISYTIGGQELFLRNRAHPDARVPDRWWGRALRQDAINASHVPYAER